MQMNMSAIGGTNMRGYTFKTLAEEVLRNSRELTCIVFSDTGSRDFESEIQ